MAERLGMPVYRLECEMPAAELREWMGLWRLRAAEAERAQRKGGHGR